MLQVSFTILMNVTENLYKLSQINSYILAPPNKVKNVWTNNSD